MPGGAVSALDGRAPTPGRDRGIGLCVLVVVALHAMLLALPERTNVPPDGTRKGTIPLQLRMVAQAQPKQQLAVPRSRAAPSVHPAARPIHVGERSAANESLPIDEMVSGSAGEPAQPVTPPAPDFGWFVWGIDAEGDYYPRAALSVGPAPTQPIQIEYPAIDDPRDTYVSELTLYIDEAGVVSRVAVDGPALPGPLEQAARNAFLQARFNPGQIEGRAVKSRIRVEVVFDSRPLTS